MCTLLAPFFLVFVLLFASIEASGIPRCSGNSEGARDDDHLGHRFESNCIGTTFLENGEVVNFVSNRLGLRDKDYDRRPSKGTFRVLLVGASQEVNHSRVSGFGVAFERRLNELLQQKPKKGIKRIEVINGSERAFNTIRSYLRLSELLEVYESHAVIYVDPYLDLFLEEYLDHYRATGRSADGAVAFMGEFGRFWPLSEKYTPILWGFPMAESMFRLSATIRMTLLLYGQALIGGMVDCPSRRGNCLVHWHNRYLDKIQQVASGFGSRTIFIFGRRLGKDFPNKPLARYLPSYWAERLYIKPVLPETEVERYLLEMRERPNSWEMNADMRKIYEESYQKVNDLHPTEKDSNELGRILADNLFSKLPFKP